MQQTEGRKKQSLTDSSYDAWIKYYRPDENSSNTRISYYSKGCVAAFLLDVKIRKSTDGKKSLDDVMRLMFDRYSDSGFTPDEFRQVASEVAGRDLSAWFDSAIDSTDELDFSDLEFVGLQIPTSAKQPVNSDEQDSDEPEDDQDDPKPWIGLSTSGDSKVTVSSIKPGSPAYESGINTGDEIIAIEGFRVSRGIDSRLKQFNVGDTVDVLIARRGKLIELPVTIAAEINDDWKLKFAKKPGDDQKQQLDAWLGTIDNKEAGEDETAEHEN